MAKKATVQLPTETPAHNHMMAVKAEANHINNFLEWLLKRVGDGDEDARYDTRVIDIHPKQLIDEYLEIDQAAIEDECREMIAGLQAGHALDEARKDLLLTDD